MTFQLPSPAHEIAAVLKHELAQGHVLWMVPGGSAAKLASGVATLLQDIDTSRLIVTLTDERFGAPGWEHSNGYVLDEIHHLLPRTLVHPVLRGLSREETAGAWEAWLQSRIPNASVMILTGIGTDGHVLGIKPASPALETDHWVSSYRGDDYERITVTAAFLDIVTTVWLYAEGADKSGIIDRLHEERSDSNVPAQLLKKVPNFCVYYKEHYYSEGL